MFCSAKKSQDAHWHVEHAIRRSKGALLFVPFLSFDQVFGNGCMSHKSSNFHNKNRDQKFAHQTALSLSAALCRDTELPEREGGRERDREREGTGCPEREGTGWSKVHIGVEHA